MENGAELTGLFAYLNRDDEMQVLRTAYAIVKAFGGDKPKKGKAHDIDDEDEEVIDTTKPEFAQNFKGFINEPGKPTQGQRQFQRQMNTEIIMG